MLGQDSYGRATLTISSRLRFTGSRFRNCYALGVRHDFDVLALKNRYHYDRRMVSSPGSEEERMTTLTPGSAGQPDRTGPGRPAGPTAPAGLVTEYGARSETGVRVLVLSVVALIAGIVMLVVGIKQSADAAKITLIVVAVVLLIAGGIGVRGLTSVIAGEARVVQLFGRYR